MKRIICLLVFVICCQGAFAQDGYVYTDASTLPIFGKVCPDTFEPFSRFPESLRGTVRKDVWDLGLDSSGLYIRFSSDAGKFKFKWTSRYKTYLDNMTGIGVRGMTLYVLDKRGWQFLTPVRPDNNSKESVYECFADRLAGSHHEYMLYLSLYDGVQDLQIGIPEGYTIAASTLNSPRAEKPIIAYGTSILQGASASSPGLCGTAQLSRRVDRQVINLGFSGHCLLEAPLAEFMASYEDPGMFIIDNWNRGVEVGEKGLEICLRILCAAHPKTVILVVDRPKTPLADFSDVEMKTYTSKRDLAEDVVCKFRKEGNRNVYHVTPDVLGEGLSGTCDGIHFNDEAFTKWVDALVPFVKKAYKN